MDNIYNNNTENGNCIMIFAKAKTKLRRRTRDMKTNRVLSAILAFVMIMSMIPFGVMSVSAETVKLSGSTDAYVFTADSWTFEHTNETNGESFTTIDGTQITDSGVISDGVIKSNTIGEYTSYQSQGGIITTVDSFDLSEGFSFKFDLGFYAHAGSKWGNTFAVNFGDAFAFAIVGFSAEKSAKYQIGTGTYVGKSVDWDTYGTFSGSELGHYDTGKYIANGSVATDDILAPSNTSFEIVYKDGMVSVYAAWLVSDENPTGIVTWSDGSTQVAVSAATLTDEQIVIDKKWSYVDDLTFIKNISLTGVDATGDEHEHVFSGYVSDGNATCTTPGTQTAICDVSGCSETDVKEYPALGHNWGDWVADTDAGVKVRTCTRCSETETKSLYETVGAGESYSFTEASWTVTPGSNVTVYTKDDGKTFSIEFLEAKKYEADGIVGYSMNGMTIESVDTFDLSEGFVFTVDTHLLARIGGVWGGNDNDGNASKIKIGDFELRFWYTWQKPELYIVAYNNGEKIGQSTYKYTWLSGSNANNVVNKTAEDVSFVNTTFTIEYKDGNLSVYKASLVTESNPTGLVTWDSGVTSFAIESSAFAASEIYLKKGWSFIEQNDIFANISLKGIEPAEDGVAPEFEGCQDATVDGKLNVRFVGTINTTDYSGIGFDIEAAAYSKAWNIDTTIVYAKIVGSIDTGVTEEYTAESFGAQYIYAATICGIPTTGTVEFTVTTYGTLLDGTKVTGDTYTVTYTDGVFVSINPAIA